MNDPELSSNIIISVEVLGLNSLFYSVPGFANIEFGSDLAFEQERDTKWRSCSCCRIRVS